MSIADNLTLYEAALKHAHIVPTRNYNSVKLYFFDFFLDFFLTFLALISITNTNGPNFI